MAIEESVKNIIELTGENPNRPGLEKTPFYVTSFYKEFFDGYSQNLQQFDVSFPNSSNAEQVVKMKGIRFYSMCEHHLLPFQGKVNISYIPNKKLLGFSEFVGIVNMYAHRLQVQERMNQQILDALVEILDPKECTVEINATHLCMKMWGVKDTHGKAVTSMKYSRE